MEHYVAYHSTPYTETAFRPIGKAYGFYSRKHKNQLLEVIGNKVWMFSGTRENKQMVYRLHGFYIASEVSETEEDERFSYLVSGRGQLLKKPLPVSGLDWFQELYDEQNNFSFGMNRIKSSTVVAELEKLM